MDELQITTTLNQETYRLFVSGHYWSSKFFWGRRKRHRLVGRGGYAGKRW